MILELVLASSEVRVEASLAAANLHRSEGVEGDFRRVPRALRLFDLSS